LFEIAENYTTSFDSAAMNKIDLITAEREIIENKFQLMIENFEIKTSKNNNYMRCN